MRYIKYSLLLFLIVLNKYLSYGQIKSASGKKVSAIEMDRFIKDQMDSLKMPGLSIAIIKNQRIVYHRALGVTNIKTQDKVSPNTLFEAASLSKPVFACLVTTLARNKLLDLDKPLYQYLPNPELEHDDRYKLITARMVLCHTTGLPNWRGMVPDQKLNIQFTPGEQFSYSGEAYQYLAQVAAHITKNDSANPEELFQKVIAQTAGMKHSYFSGNENVYNQTARPHAGDTLTADDQSWDRNGFNVAGGLRTEAVDFAKFLISEMSGSSEMLKEYIKLPEDHILRQYFGYTAWGLGFAIKESPYGPLYVHAGNNHGFQAAFMIHQPSKTAYVFFTNCDKGMEFDRQLQSLLLEGN